MPKGEIDNEWACSHDSRNKTHVRVNGANMKASSTGFPEYVCTLAVFTSACLVSLTGDQVRAQQQTPTDAETLLRTVAATFSHRPPMSYDSEAVITYPDRIGQPGKVTQLRYVNAFRQDGERIDLTRRLLSTIDGEEKPFKISREMWDGTLFLHRTKRTEMEEHLAYVSRDKSRSDITREVELQDSFLDGIFPGSGGRHYSSMMLEADHLVLQQKMEEVNGHPCFVVESRGTFGQCTVWIDPEAGYNLRKAIIHRGPSDSSDKLPSDVIFIPTKSFDFVTQNIEVKNIDGVWFPVAGTVEKRLVLADNEASRWHNVASRSNILWNPDFDQMGAFKMDLPDGNPVSNQDVPGIMFEWRGGKMIPAIDELVMEAMEKEVAKLSSSGQTLGPQGQDGPNALDEQATDDTQTEPNATNINQDEKTLSEADSRTWEYVVVGALLTLVCLWMLLRGRSATKG